MTGITITCAITRVTCKLLVPIVTYLPSPSAAGALRQPGLELVDSNSFRTHSTNVPADYENSFSPAQTFDTQRGKCTLASAPLHGLHKQLCVARGQLPPTYAFIFWKKLVFLSKKWDFTPALDFFCPF